MAWTKMKAAVVVGIAAVIAAGTATVLVQKHMQAWQFTPARAPWSDIGASTPKAALQTLAWALTNGKMDRAEQLMRWEETNTNYGPPSSEHQIVLQSVLAPTVKDIKSFKIVSLTPSGPTEVIVKFVKTFKKSNIVPMTMTAKLRRVGNEWHVIGRIEYSRDGGVSTWLPFSVSF